MLGVMDHLFGIAGDGFVLLAADRKVSYGGDTCGLPLSALVEGKGVCCRFVEVAVLLVFDILWSWRH